MSAKRPYLSSGGPTNIERRLSEIAVVIVALLLFATCILLLRADYEVR